MLSQSPNSDSQVGFVSFSQDLLQNEKPKRDGHFDSVDMSFAEALKDENEAVTNNLADYSSQNEGSVRKREAKLSAKKSDLYLQIMREHGYSEDAIEKKLS
jgi:hypothetical protein